MDAKDLTVCRQACRILADGKPRTTREMGELLGLDSMQASDLMVLLKKTNRISPMLPTYRLTATGEKFAAHEPKKAKTHAQVNREYRARKRAELGLPPSVERQPAVAIDTVSRAIASRPALQMAWTALEVEGA